MCILISFIFSCRKDNHTHVSGTVLDATTNHPISGATVYLQQRDPNCISCFSPGSSGKATSDANGKFVFDFTADPNYSYSVAAEANKYFNDYSTGGISISSGQTNNSVVTLRPIAYLKVHAKNTTPYDANDWISVNVILGGGVAFYGMIVDTTFTQWAYGNSANNLVWFVKKNGVQHNFSANVACTSFDTTTYNINY